MIRTEFANRSSVGTKREALARAQARARFGAVRAPFQVETAAGPLPGAVVRAILDHADDRTELESGHIAHRLSRAAARRPEVAQALGAHAERATRVCVVWDAEDCQLVDVREDQSFEDMLWAMHRRAA